MNDRVGQFVSYYSISPLKPTSVVLPRVVGFYFC